jgi:oligopeptide transport system permease protein
MIRFLLQRLLVTGVTLGLLASMTFFLLRLAPGGPFDSEHVFPPEIQANLEARYGLNQPLPVQFQQWMLRVIRGDLSESFQYLGRPVTEIIAETLPVSATLGLLALGVALIGGVLIGGVSAWRKDSWLDRLFALSTLTGVSLPSYLVASLGVLIFALWLNWLPPALWEDPSSAVLPVLTLALKPLALVSRLIRVSLIEVLASDFIRTALSKGVPPGRLLFKHALRNALVPVASILGGLTAQLLTGSFLVEIVFQIPGLGKHFAASVLNRDYPLVMGVMLTYGIILILAQTASDLLVGWLDPRIRILEETTP